VTPGSGNIGVAVTASTAGSSDVDGSIAAISINFGDGSAPVSVGSATHSYSVAGTYTVTAMVTDNLGTSSTANATVTVASANKPPVPALSVSATSAYAPAIITVSTAGSSDPDGTIATSSISWGDGSANAVGPSATHSYTSPGNYTITATVTDNSGASSSIAGVVSVLAQQVIISSPTNGVTATSPVHVAASGYSGNAVTTMQIYLDGAMVYQIKSASLDTSIKAAVGAHRIAVKGWDGAGRSFLSAVNVNVVNAPPLAALSLSASSIVAGGSVTANIAGSSDPDGSIASGSVDFGDGTVVSGSSASHQYKITGTYTVRATVTDNLGASATTSKMLTVDPRHVIITSPTFSGTTNSSVLVTGTAHSGYTINATQVYLDGALKYQTTSSTASITLSLTTGTHKITVKGWDTAGSFMSSVNVTRQ
jgi:PKD repeat protein